MASLIITTGRKAGKYYPLGHRTNVVGRDEGVLIQIIDGFVSRKHLQLRYNEDTELYYAADMKSRHQGQYWIGGWERHGDKAQGTLTSVPFTVTAYGLRLYSPTPPPAFGRVRTPARISAVGDARSKLATFGKRLPS